VKNATAFHKTKGGITQSRACISSTGIRYYSVSISTRLIILLALILLLLQLRVERVLRIVADPLDDAQSFRPAFTEQYPVADRQILGPLYEAESYLKVGGRSQ
jgi:hypothetical protein